MSAREREAAFTPVLAEGPQIVIVEYDSRWPQLFAEEQRGLTEAAPDLFVEFHHVGSTAVPGLAGKPVVDMLAGVRSLADVEPHASTLGERGYFQLPFLPGRLFFLKRMPPYFNLHIMAAAAVGDSDQLILRDYLRAHPEAAAEYTRLKCEIVARIKDYREYTPAKTEFIQSLIDHACDERGLPHHAAWQPQ
jgi:GrpB-like predicted nucleotidyltransferase (UPF0157 family)